MTSDPFAVLYESPPEATETATATELFISGRLNLLHVRSGIAGDWIHVNGQWFRRLDANAFLWLRAAVLKAIRSNTLASEFSDVLNTLEDIAAAGIKSGAFTAPEIANHCEAPEWFSFSSGIPRWAEDF